MIGTEKTLYTDRMPPKIEEVKIYFSQKSVADAEAEAFFRFYERKLWTSKTGRYYTSWKCLAYRWIASLLKLKPWLFNRNSF